MPWVAAGGDCIDTSSSVARAWLRQRHPHTDQHGAHHLLLDRRWTGAAGRAAAEDRQTAERLPTRDRLTGHRRRVARGTHLARQLEVGDRAPAEADRALDRG